MDPTDIGLFRLAERRLSWIDQRQQVLAQNIANADTPGYRARDLPTFAESLAGQGVDLARTSGAHLQGTVAQASGKQQAGTGRAPNGNTVGMEAELAKVADTASNQELVTNLYHKYQGLFRLVLGRSG